MNLSFGWWKRRKSLREINRVMKLMNEGPEFKIQVEIEKKWGTWDYEYKVRIS